MAAHSVEETAHDSGTQHGGTPVWGVKQLAVIYSMEEGNS